MKYQEFKQKFAEYPVILARDVAIGADDPQTVRNQLLRWQKRGLLAKLKKGIYVINEADRKTTMDLRFIANVLYEPSYVSLEYVLSIYGLIPEAVHTITSVTTRKTMRIENALGTFVYQHVKAGAFRGFRLASHEKWASIVAEPEKALIDYLYFHLSSFGLDAQKMLEESLRLQNLDMLDEKKLTTFSALFDNAKLTRLVESVCRLRRKELS